LFYSFSYTDLSVNPESETLTYDADYSFLGIKYKSRLSVYILTLKSVINTPYETRSKEVVLPTSFLDYYIKLSSMVQDMYGKLGNTSIFLKITYENGNKIDTSLLELDDGIYKTTLRDMFKSETKKVNVKTNVKDNKTLIRIMSWINSQKYNEFENLLTSLMNFLNNYI